MSSELTKTTADIALAASWAGYFISFVVEVNEVLRMVLLIVSIVAGVFTARFYYRRTLRL
jgi:hypothetical protein